MKRSNLLPNGHQPFFSIITCTFNSAKYLRETIASVEQQTFNNFEHVFIDAFSSDETTSIIRDYQARWPSRVVFHQLPAKGISNAMNAGVELAKGVVVLHLHSDDRLASKDVLEIVQSQFAASGASVVAGNCELVGCNSPGHTWPLQTAKRSLLKLFFLPLMFYSNLVPHPSTYVKKSVFQKYGGFDEQYKVVMDYDFWLRIFHNEKMRMTNEVLAIYRFHAGTVSTTQMSLGLSEIEEIRKKHMRSYPVAYGIFVLFILPVLRLRRLLKSRI